jgi:membrane protein implicated in regulation of membrane protease activity
MLGFFLLGMVPGLKVLWDLALLAFAATAGYLALLIHIHRRAVERDVKVVDIQERLRNQNANATADTVIPVRRIEPEDVDWSDDELLGPAFGLDYDEIMAGGR